MPNCNLISSNVGPAEIYPDQLGNAATAFKADSYQATLNAFWAIYDDRQNNNFKLQTNRPELITGTALKPITCVAVTSATMAVSLVGGAVCASSAVAIPNSASTVVRALAANTTNALKLDVAAATMYCRLLTTNDVLLKAAVANSHLGISLLIAGSNALIKGVAAFNTVDMLRGALIASNATNTAKLNLAPATAVYGTLGLTGVSANSVLTFGTVELTRGAFLNTANSIGKLELNSAALNLNTALVGQSATTSSAFAYMSPLLYGQISAATSVNRASIFLAQGGQANVKLAASASINFNELSLKTITIGANAASNQPTLNAAVNLPGSATIKLNGSADKLYNHKKLDAGSALVANVPAIIFNANWSLTTNTVQAALATNTPTLNTFFLPAAVSLVSAVDAKMAVSLVGTALCSSNVASARLMYGFNGAVTSALLVGSAEANYGTLSFAGSSSLVTTAGSSTPTVWNGVASTLANSSKLNIASVGDALTVWRGCIGGAALALNLPSNKQELTFTDTKIFMDGSVSGAASATAILYRLLYGSAALKSNVPALPDANVNIGKIISLATNNASSVLTLPALANDKVTVNRGLTANVNTASTAIAYAGIPLYGSLGATSALASVTKFGLNVRCFIDTVNVSAQTNRPEFGAFMPLNAVISAPNLAAVNLFTNVTRGCFGSSAPLLRITGGPSYPLGANLRKDVEAVPLQTNQLNIKSSALPAILLGLGNPDFPQQLSEYTKYSLPTGTSIATPLDENNSPVLASNSVFGAMLLRLNPAVNSSTSVSARVRAVQLGSATQYVQGPEYNNTLILLRTSTYNTNTLQRALFGNEAVSIDVARTANYSTLPRSYATSVESMGSTGNSVLANPTVAAAGTYSSPTSIGFNGPPAVLFFASSLIRHNYNTSASTLEPVAVATDYSYPDTAPRKLTRARIQSTVSNSGEGLAPIYAAPAFRLFTPAQYDQLEAGGVATKFKASAAVLPQDNNAAAAHIHASDTIFSFMPIKAGTRYSYSSYLPAATPTSSTVLAAGYLGAGTTSAPLEYTVAVGQDVSTIDDPAEYYNSDAQCVLRVYIYPYTASNNISTVFIDIPILGLSVNSSIRFVIDSSYRWFVEQCLPGGAYAATHRVRGFKEYQTAANPIPVTTSKAVLAVTRPIVALNDGGANTAAMLSLANDRNFVLGEFSLAISRPDSQNTGQAKINVNPGSEISAITAYDGASGEATQVSAFDSKQFTLYLKSDGTLGCTRNIDKYGQDQWGSWRILDAASTDLTPLLPPEVKTYIAAGGTFSKIKVGESITALLTTPTPNTNTGRKLFVWGYNTFGHLDVPLEVDANFYTNRYINNVNDFDFHSGHIAVIMDNGKLYSWGCSQSSLWKSAGTSVIKAIDIGEKFSIVAVERYNSADPLTPIVAIEKYGDFNAAVPAGLILATKTEVWTATQAGLPIYAGKVLACGAEHAVALKSDGTVVCWGSDTYGQCTVPAGLTSIIAVDAGDYHTVALKSDGTVYAWGRNNYGQTTIPSGLKAKILSAGGDFCAAIRKSNSTDIVAGANNDEIDDTVACWGRNNKGQCNVPKCEGLSYNPTTYKYRMRFWSVECGWDHVVAIRRDDDSAKWIRDHAEITRLENERHIKVRFKTSAGTVVYPSLRGLSIEYFSGNPGYYVATDYKGVTVFTATSSDNGYTFYTPSTSTLDGARYRIKVTSAAFGAGVYEIQRSVSPFTTWTSIEFTQRDYSGCGGDPNAYVDIPNFPYIYSQGVGIIWDGFGATPSWKPNFKVNTSNAEIYDLVNAATGEYFDLDYSLADTNPEALEPWGTWGNYHPKSYFGAMDRVFVAWGNPLAYSASVDKSDYLAYYPTYNTDTLSEALGSDIKEPPTRQSDNLSRNLANSFSYVGLGKQLGVTSLTSGLPDKIYLGPTSLQAIDGTYQDIITSCSTSSCKNYGGENLYLTISGTDYFFNKATSFNSGSDIRCYASPQYGLNADEELYYFSGFNNNAVYVEAFSQSLPAGYSVVPNASAGAYANSYTGYHIKWTGTISGNSVTLILTGAYVSYGTVYLPYDPDSDYRDIGLPAAYLTTLGLKIKIARVVRHLIYDVGYQFNPARKPIIAGTYAIAAGKHVTGITNNSSELAPVSNTSFYGLRISESSPQRSGDVFSMSTTFSLRPISTAINYRSAVLIGTTTLTSNSKVATYLQPYGDNKYGQINIPLFGPYVYRYNEAISWQGTTLALPENWFMNYGQTNIGHTQIPTKSYGYKKVSCGQFHTVAVDDTGGVEAWGLNNALYAPYGGSIMYWDAQAVDTSGNGAYSYYTTANGSSLNTNKAQLGCKTGDMSSGLVPHTPLPVAAGCDSRDTEGAVFLADEGFADSNTVLFEDVATCSGTLRIGLTYSNDETSIYVTAKGSSTLYVSNPYPGIARLVTLRFYTTYSSGEPNIVTAARINGTLVTWGVNLDRVSPLVKTVVRQSYFGIAGTSSLATSAAFRYYTKPTTSISDLFAGDRNYGFLCPGETGPSLPVRGTFVNTQNYNLGTPVVGTDYVGVNPAFPALAAAMPKDYVVTLVNRTYTNALNAATKTCKNVTVFIPSGSTYSVSNFMPPSSITAGEKDENLLDNVYQNRQNAIAVAAGDACFVAITNASYSATQGTLVAWGASTGLGDGVLTPPSGSDYTAVNCRNRHAAALKADGSIVCWGDNTYGQCNAPAGTGYTSLMCGDTFTAAINSSGKIVCWGRLNGSAASVPAPYSNMTFSSISCGIDHIVGRVAANYSENVVGGIFSVSAGDVVAFGNNSNGQCNIPGFSYSPNNEGFTGRAVAGGNYTAYEIGMSGMRVATTGAGTKTIVLHNRDFDIAFSNPESEKNSQRIEGYVVHKGARLCPPPLETDHPYYSVAPYSTNTSNKYNVNLGMDVDFGKITDATNVPTNLRRGGSKKAKLIAAGRLPYYSDFGYDEFMWGSGYTVVIDEDNAITVFGGELRALGCPLSSYVRSTKSFALRNLSAAGILPDDSFVQLDTYRGYVYALKSSGDLARWGYDDVSKYEITDFFAVNSSKKRYIALPDDSLQDEIAYNEFNGNNKAIAMAYITGLPGMTESWSVEVSLDRYFNGVPTNVRKFVATGKTPQYSIQDAVHFAETFMAVDTWPGTATYLDSQYVLSVTPRGVFCTINSASMFIMNLDSKTTSNARVLNEGGSSTDVADFLLLNRKGTGFESASLLSLGAANVNAANESTSAITLTASNTFAAKSYLRNSYGSSARIESLDATGTIAKVAGRIANPVTITPAKISDSICWYRASSLTGSAGAGIASWANSISGIGALTSSGSFVPNIVTAFNGTALSAAEFDSASSAQDRMAVAANLSSETPFTFFVVLKKAANTQQTYCAFGKYIDTGAASSRYRVQGVGFKQGQPVLFTGATHDVASGVTADTNAAIICGYYGGDGYKGLRRNGIAVSTYANTQQSFYIPAPSTSVFPGYHLGSAIAGANAGTSANFHDSNDVYAEVVAFDRALSLEEIEIVEGYLSNQFGLGGQLTVRDSLSQLYSPGLEQNKLLLESANMAGSTGKAETWLGMFEIGLNHRSARTGSDNHAPILAEFDVLVNETIGMLTKTVACKSNVTSNMLVDNNTKYIVGNSRGKLSTAATLVIPLNMGSASASAVVNAGAQQLNLRLGLAGRAFGTLGTFGATNCTEYGCADVAPWPPELLIVKQTFAGNTITAAAAVTATLGKIATFNYSPAVISTFSVDAVISNTVALNGTVLFKLNASIDTFRSSTINMRTNAIRGKSTVTVCLPNMIVKGPSSAKPKSQIPYIKDGSLDGGVPMVEPQ